MDLNNDNQTQGEQTYDNQTQVEENDGDQTQVEQDHVNGNDDTETEKLAFKVPRKFMPFVNEAEELIMKKKKESSSFSRQTKRSNWLPSYLHAHP